MKVVQNKKIACQVYDGEAVLVDPAGSVCRVLNATATRIWELCEVPRRLDELTAQLQEEYDIGADELTGDIEELVREFLDKSLFEEVL